MPRTRPDDRLSRGRFIRAHYGELGPESRAPRLPEVMMARTHPAAEEETRQVRVEDPALSPSTNQRLTEEVQETLGTDEVRVPAGRAHPSRGETPSGRPANRERPAATTVAALSEAGVHD